MTWQEDFALAMNTRGYVVIGSQASCAIGAKLDWLDSNWGHIKHPFIVVSETDAADATAQTILWGLDLKLQKTYRHYYRVTTD